MNDPDRTISKFLSYVLRHSPQSIQLNLDSQGWAEVDELLACSAKHGRKLSLEILQRIVATNDKKRFAFDASGQRIRANQGHSITVDLALESCEPPAILFHGTASKNLPSIRTQGLIKGNRHHVHLSLDETTAIKVGQRHGRPVVLRVDSGSMYRNGQQFYRSENGVWLTESVPVQYISFPQ